MPLYDFVCEDGHTFEHRCSSDGVDELVIACKAVAGCTARASYRCTVGGLDHGIGCYRDALREGRITDAQLEKVNHPDQMPLRTMTSGRGSRPGR